MYLKEDFQKFTGNILIAHTRYGSAKVQVLPEIVSPLEESLPCGMISLVHNGDLENKEDLKQELIENG